MLALLLFSPAFANETCPIVNELDRARFDDLVTQLTPTAPKLAYTRPAEITPGGWYVMTARLEVGGESIVMTTALTMTKPSKPEHYVPGERDTTWMVTTNTMGDVLGIIFSNNGKQSEMHERCSIGRLYAHNFLSSLP